MGNMKSIKAVLQDHAGRLKALPGVFGVAVADSPEGPCIELHTEKATDELRKAAPKELEGYPVRIREMGKPELF